MKEVKLKLLGAKGFKKLNGEISFSHWTEISGDNGVGKSSWLDAWTWLLYDKDRFDRSKFDLKYHTLEGKTIDKKPVEVWAVLECDGKEVRLRKTMQEVWKQKKESPIETLDGHETIYEWNDVRLKTASEFNRAISEMMPESITKIISNPLYFNNDKLFPWKERRKMLLEISGSEIDQEYIFGELEGEYPKEVSVIRSELSSGKSISQYSDHIRSLISKVKEKKAEIKIRIEEKTRENTFDSYDFDKVREDILNEKENLEYIEDLILNDSKARDEQLKGVKSLEDDLYLQKSLVNKITREIHDSVGDSKSKIDSLPGEIRAKMSLIESEISAQNNLLSLKKEEIKTISSTLSELSSKWSEENAKKFSIGEDDIKCHECGREFEGDDLTAASINLEAVFNKNRIEKKAEIEILGKQCSEKLKMAKSQLASMEEALAKKSEELDTLKIEFKDAVEAKNSQKSVEQQIQERLSFSSDYLDASKRITDLEEKIRQIKADAMDDDQTEALLELTEKKKQVTEKIEYYNKLLGVEEELNKAKERINELREQDNLQGHEFTKLNGLQHVLKQFDRMKATIIENNINNMLEFTTFRMFREQVNGDLEDLCEVMHNGVPWNVMNDAQKIMCGLDIINTICKAKSISVPIWIDQKESTNTIPKVISQLVTLKVTEKGTPLTVTHLE